MVKGLILVTGASRGIGFAIGSKLLRAGFPIHIVARSEENLSKAYTRLKNLGPVAYSVVDLSSKVHIKEFLAHWDKTLWALVNNAGIWAEERLDEPDREIWDPIMKLNLEGVYFLTKGLQRWIPNGGRIVNISSQLGTGGRAGFGAYSASKHAVIGLTRCWALELGARHITVNAVCPGWVRTESNLIEIRQRADDDGETLESKIAEISRALTLGRFIEPEEVANLVAFLIGTEGSGITGQTYEIK